MPTYISVLKLPGILALILTLSACIKDKGVIETQLVITKDIKNIPTDYNIVNFDTYDENHIFAIGLYPNQDGGNVRLFLSSNGGSSWNEITSSFNPAWNENMKTVKSVVYMDESNLAFVAGNKLYRSYDGGQNWTPTTNGFQILPIFFADKSEDGKLLFIEDFNSSWATNNIYKSAYDSPVFSSIGTLPPAEGEYSAGRLYGNYLMLLDYEFDFFRDWVHGYNLSTGEFETMAMSSTAYEYPVDAMRVGDRIFLIRKEGKLNFMSPAGAFVDYSFYNFHNQDYYSGEFMGDYYVAVGDKTISTNVNGEWEEAINTDISGHKELFRKVKKINSDYFYVSGDNGLFFKGTFK
ncbi:MAG: WD40/YVTN/BNR-like repeat-containing protein [Fluviicola sp.]